MFERLCNFCRFLCFFTGYFVLYGFYTGFISFAGYYTGYSCSERFFDGVGIAKFGYAKKCVKLRVVEQFLTLREIAKNQNEEKRDQILEDRLDNFSGRFRGKPPILW